MSNFMVYKRMFPGIKITTDFHTVQQIEEIPKGVIDMIQIPAFLCRQTDLLMAANDSGLAVNVKKGQFMAPSQVGYIIDKLPDVKERIITERGFQFGYNNYIVDFVGLQEMLDMDGFDVCLDLSHSLQTPNTGPTTSGVNLKYGYGLMKAAKAIGIDTFFAETMPDPSKAKSDKLTTYPTEELLSQVKQCL